MKIVILGCGRVGARLAQLMESEGHEVSIIDSDPDALNKLPETFRGRTTLGTGIDADVLKAAGIEDADAFAAVTNFDNTNIMAGQVAKEIFGVQNVLARIYDPGRETLYQELGLETVCPTTLVSTTARDILLANSVSSATPATSSGTSAPSTNATVAAEAEPNTSRVTMPVSMPPNITNGGQKPEQNGHGSLRSLFRH
jgi:trk system potassium uptake protein